MRVLPRFFACVACCREYNTYKCKVTPAAEVFVFEGMYQFLLYFYDTFVAHFLVLDAVLA